MNLKNYTTEIPAETTIARIEAKLAAVGATHVMKMYGPDKRVSAVFFNMPQGTRSYAIKLPANVHLCYEAMWKEHCKHATRWTDATRARIREQAEKTAWKIVLEWIEIQVSMIVMQQADPLQVFMAYAWDGEQTYYERLKSGGFKQLPESTNAQG